MTFPQTVFPNQENPETPIQEDLLAVAQAAIYGPRPEAHSGLTWGYHGTGGAVRWGGLSVADGTLSLTASSTNYVVVNRSTGAVSVSTSTTNWNNNAVYARAHVLVTNGSGVTSHQDHRAGLYGTHGPLGATAVQWIPVACGDETTPITTGLAKVTFHWPFSGTLSSVWAGLTTPQTSGSILTVDLNDGGASMLSTKLTIDNTEETSLTAAAPPVLSDTAVTQGGKATIDVDQVGDGTATGLKVYIGVIPA